MPVPVISLPYASKALEPHISQRTLSEHHGAHYKSYVDKTNAAIAGGPLAHAALNDIVRAMHESGEENALHSAAQAWNHGFYWFSLTAQASRPDAALAAAIDASFGSLKALTKALTEEAETHFASGWAWLVAAGDKLEIVSTHDAGCPLTGTANPLLTIDVWEHAYYLDHQSERGKYVEAVVANLLDWDFASQNFARGTAWCYPD